TVGARSQAHRQPTAAGALRTGPAARGRVGVGVRQAISGGYTPLGAVIAGVVVLIGPAEKIRDLPGGLLLSRRRTEPLPDHAFVGIPTRGRHVVPPPCLQ